MDDALYLIENHVAYSKPKNCLRVLRDGRTWSSLATDVPRVIEFRDGGELYCATLFEGLDGIEQRAPLERAGTWEQTPNALESTGFRRRPRGWHPSPS
jgi:hypothetical protein